jgi:hypothetical protein
VFPFAALFLGHVRASGRRLRSAVMAAVLSVAEANGMSVVGDSEAFRRPERPERGELVPATRAARALLSWSQALLRGRRPAVR